ncbi:hypothetical protein AGMMS49982_07320 [Bacteroidia bacterium]|nr:hypothetical protein AGMMS49982_07320 [Bacteroidia bacterium]
MKSLECVIFNVEHGLAIFIKSPNDYGLMIDCGGSETFSPIKWIRSHYNATNQNISYYKGQRRIAELKITHLHKDHFEDVGSFYLHKEDKPKRLLSDKETLKFIDKKIKEAENDDNDKVQVLKTFKKFREDYNKDATDKINYGFDLDSCQLTYREADEVSASEDKIINNRSYVFAIGYAGKKIIIPGDIEIEGWKKLLNKEKAKKILANTNFFIASHHGHKSGFTSDIIALSGKPDLFIVSAKSGDEHIDTSYSKDDNCKGYNVIVNGKKEISISKNFFCFFFIK